MSIQAALDKAIDSVLADELDVATFQVEYERLFNSAAANELTAAQESYYGLIADRSEFTYIDPHPNADSYIDYGQFKEFLRKHRSDRASSI